MRTGAFYGIVRAAALIGLAALVETCTRLDLALSVAGCGFAAGMLLFSLGLFGMALTGIDGFGC